MHRRGNIHVILRHADTSIGQHLFQHRHHQLLVIDLEPVELVVQQRSDSGPQRARQKFGPLQDWNTAFTPNAAQLSNSPMALGRRVTWRWLIRI